MRYDPRALWIWWEDQVIVCGLGQREAGVGRTGRGEAMLERETFIRMVLEGGLCEEQLEVLPGIDPGEGPANAPKCPPFRVSFALRLLVGSGCGFGVELPCDERVLGDAPPSRLLPKSVIYWGTDTARPFQILFVALQGKGSGLLRGYPSREFAQLEEALHVMAKKLLEELHRKGGRADNIGGAPDKTLCVVAVHDDRYTKHKRHMVCFGTRCRATNAFESFILHEKVCDWERPLAEEYLGHHFERHFRWLMGGERWQEAFLSAEELKGVKRCAEVWSRSRPKKEQLQETIDDLLHGIAGSLGLPPKGGRHLRMCTLPEPYPTRAAQREEKCDGCSNRFQGVRLFDTKERLLGYILFAPKKGMGTEQLRHHLAQYPLHNTLLLTLDGKEPTLELYRGAEPLRGCCAEGSRHNHFGGAGGVVQLLTRFLCVSPSPINTPEELARELAWRAQRLRIAAKNQLHVEASRPKEQRPLRDLLGVLCQTIVTLDEAEFADAYAQSVTYGLVAARWMSSSQVGPCFTRSNMGALLPSTSPSLRKLFQCLVNLPSGHPLAWLLDDLTMLLSRTMVTQVFQGYKDPTIHFYQLFLDAYDPRIRRAQGVYYTPDEVVSSMVQMAHKLLQERFGLPLGLADTTTWEAFAAGKRVEIPEGVEGTTPVVQVLDPATGTGTFLLRTIEVVYRTMRAHYAKQGLDKRAALQAWRAYVRAHLLPRLHGFEVLMAPYIVGHLRLGLALQETGFLFGDTDQIQISLTNALDPHTVHVFGARGVTVLFGNPPYGIRSSNLSAYARLLVAPFKSIHGKKIKEKGALQLERNLNDDYVKFFAHALATLRRSPYWICALITNRAYTDNPTLRGLRWALLQAATSIDLIDLHGDLKRQERPPEGKRNDNIFGIRQGVAITVLLKENMDQEAARVRRGDLWGRRSEKLAALTRGGSRMRPISPRAPYYTFVDEDAARWSEYDQFVRLEEVAHVYSNGLVTGRDRLVIDYDPASLQRRIRSFALGPGKTEAVCRRLGVRQTRGWDATAARAKVARSIERGERWCMPLLYRPFEKAWIYYHPALIQTMASTSWQMCVGENVALLLPRSVKSSPFCHVIVTRQMSEAIVLSTKTSVNGNCFPLWVYEDAKKRVLEVRGLAGRSMGHQAGRRTKRVVNIGAAKLLGEKCSREQEGVQDEEAFYYAAAVLHSVTYRERYGELLGRGFPRLPKSASAALVKELAAVGRKLPDIYDLTGENYMQVEPLTLVGEGDGVVTQAVYDTSLQGVWINRYQYVAPISEEQWAFTIGDYQVIKRWFVGGRAVTRKGRALLPTDFVHLARMGLAIDELRAVPHHVDRIIVQHGGWATAFCCREGDAGGGNRPLGR